MADPFQGLCIMVYGYDYGNQCHNKGIFNPQSLSINQMFQNLQGIHIIRVITSQLVILIRHPQVWQQEVNQNFITLIHG